MTSTNIHTGKHVQGFIRNKLPDMTSLITNIHNLIANSNSSRCLVYKEMDPNFLVHDIYGTKRTINEFYLTAFTCFPWNIRGCAHLPVKDRLCSLLCTCGLVVTERHLVELCPLTQENRKKHSITGLEDVHR